jgi:hypothetical protein
VQAALGRAGRQRNEAAPNRANPFSGISDVEPRNNGHSENGAPEGESRITRRSFQA